MKKKKWLFLFACAISLMIVGGCNSESPAGSSNQTEINQSNLMEVGDNKSGYYQVPKNFERKTDKAVDGTTMTAYSNPEGTFAVVSMPTNFTGNFEETVYNLKTGYTSSGFAMKETRTTVSGLTVAELTTIVEGNIITISVINGTQSIKVLAFTYNAEIAEHKDQILNSFREE